MKLIKPSLTKQNLDYVVFEVLKAVIMKSSVFWGLMEKYNNTYKYESTNLMRLYFSDAATDVYCNIV
jgi:hypothetical protein